MLKPEVELSELGGREMGAGAGDESERFMPSGGSSLTEASWSLSSSSTILRLARYVLTLRAICDSS